MCYLLFFILLDCGFSLLFLMFWVLVFWYVFVGYFIFGCLVVRNFVLWLFGLWFKLCLGLFNVFVFCFVIDCLFYVLVVIWLNVWVFGFGMFFGWRVCFSGVRLFIVFTVSGLGLWCLNYLKCEQLWLICILVVDGFCFVCFCFVCFSAC